MALFLVGVGAFLSCLSASAFAARGEDGEYNFSWLDPDKKIYVLQNRKYTKAGKAAFSLLGGIGFSHPYRSEQVLDPRISFYFSEALGIEASYSFHFFQGNSNFQALQNASPNLLPMVRQNTNRMALSLMWFPWYAKINVFNQILYFDWYFSGGAGALNSSLDTNTVSGAAANIQTSQLFAIFAGTGHQFYLSQLWMVRLDFLGAFYQAPIYGNQGASTWYSNYNFSAGVGLRL